MHIIMQTSLMPTAAMDTHGGPSLLALSQRQEPCPSVPTKAILDLAYLLAFSLSPAGNSIINPVPGSLVYSLPPLPSIPLAMQHSLNNYASMSG